MQTLLRHHRPEEGPESWPTAKTLGPSWQLGGYSGGVRHLHRGRVMAPTKTTPLARTLHRVVEVARNRHLNDRDLLGRYTAGRDEAAFTELVRRHGPRVLAACRAV